MGFKIWTMSALAAVLSASALAEDKTKDLTQEMVPTEVLILEAASKTPKRGGGSSSIGADSHDLKIQTGWFYGTAPIKTCYNAIPAFGVANKDLERIVKSSIKTWKDYFTEKKIVSEQTPKEQRLNLNFKFSGKCKGDEDLVFHFGTGPIFGNVQDLKSSQTLQAPLAFANKTQMRRNMMWSKGYIRFIGQGYYSNDSESLYPDWTNQKALEAIVIHELGHVLGFAHTPHTMMSADLMDRVYNSKDEVSLSIDQTRQLVTCQNCKTNYVLDKSNFKSETFAAWGLNPKKDIHISADGDSFVLSDGKTKVLISDLDSSRSEQTQTLFSNFSNPGNNSSQSANIYARVKSKDTSVPVILEYNSIEQKGGISLRTLKNNEIEFSGAFRR